MSIKQHHIKIIDKESFARVVLSEDFSFEERKTLVKEDFKLDFPDDIKDGEEFLNLTYDKYLSIIEEYKLDVDRVYKRERKNLGVTRKSWIIDFIKEHKTTSVKEIYIEFDKIYEYSKVGKSPRTRIKNVLKELNNKNLIIQDFRGIIKWR